jgi:hypothetical protein
MSTLGLERKRCLRNWVYCPSIRLEVTETENLNQNSAKPGRDTNKCDFWFRPVFMSRILIEWKFLGTLHNAYLLSVLRWIVSLEQAYA